MNNKSKAISAICSMEKNNIEINAENLSKALDIPVSQASINIRELLSEEYLINTTTTLTKPFSSPVTIRGKIVLTNKARDYKSSYIKETFFKWYPLVISTISLIIAILVAIYK